MIDLKMCMCFLSLNYLFLTFSHFYLDIFAWFQVSSRNLVSATPTVLDRSFFDFTCVLIMV